MKTDPGGREASTKGWRLPGVGMLRLRSEARFALLTASLSMTKPNFDSRELLRFL